MLFIRNNYRGILAVAAIVLLFLLIIPSALSEPDAVNDSIAVLPGLSHEEARKKDVLQKIGNYRILVIDAWDYSEEEIAALKKQGCKVYSYINVGSLEIWRPWYKNYRSLCLLPYEGWEDESWVNVTDSSWQEHCINLAGYYLERGIDGFFLDNIDVTEELEENAGFEKGDAEDAVTAIISGIRSLKDNPFSVIINGGASYLDYEIGKGNPFACDGICMESVYTEVTDYESDGSKAVPAADVRKKTEMLNGYLKKGIDVWDIEYTKNRLLAQDIRRKAARNGWSLYIASSYALDRPE